jgi:two-component system, NtrC family, response regulator AtoC
MNRKSPQRILVVEDDDVLRAGLQDFLLEHGIQATCSRDGEQAVQIIRQEREPFDVVLTDLMIPGKDGLEVLRTAKGHSPKTQVVIMTGFASLETAIDSMHHGAFDYITKPFQFVEIEIVLDRIEERKQLIDENLKLSESLQSLHSRLELLKDSRAKFERFIAETSEKLDQQSHKIDQCVEMIKALSRQLDVTLPTAKIAG